ncbi:MAG: hypothetical protein H6R14_1461 [Proteobacteria bacterium]|nr:hypothetical protein [Pseudomonadota bacterium]
MPQFNAACLTVRLVFLLVVCLTPFLSQGAIAAGKEGVAQLAGDIVSAGRVRMQSQRLAKLYQQLGMGLNAPQALQQIDASTAEIDAEFGRLGGTSRKSAIKRELGRCESIWQEMRVALKQIPAPNRTERVDQLADELMIHAGKLSMLIEAEGEAPVGRLLDLSSRLNMLSQRLARLYLQAQGGNRSQSVMVDIEQARKEFASGLQELDTARDNSLASRDAIGLARNQWIFFDSAINRLGVAARGDDSAVRNVATSSERIAQVLDSASAQYARDYGDATRLNR